MAERIFPIEAVVSCMAFYKIDNNLPVIVNNVHLANLVAFISGISPLTYLINRLELIAGASVCGFILVKQYPSLGEIEYPYVEHKINPDHFTPWIASVYSSLGAEITVQSAENWVPNEVEHAHLVEVNRTLQARFNL